VLNIINASLTYPDGTEVLSGISISVNCGENVALIGANGAGKTSLLLSLTGIAALTAGEIVVDDIVLCKKTLPDVRSKVGLIFQNPDDQLFMPNIYEDIAFGLRNMGLSESNVEAKVQTIAERLNITRFLQKSPLKLSGGEKRLCALATVLAMEPAYLLLDEPTAFLDPKARNVLIALLAELPQGKLIATHDFEFARAACSRVVLLAEGNVYADGGLDLLDDTNALEYCGLV